MLSRASQAPKTSAQNRPGLHQPVKVHGHIPSWPTRLGYNARYGSYVSLLAEASNHGLMCRLMPR
eukprot:2586256-Amphidinium_carterae.2